MSKRKSIGGVRQHAASLALPSEPKKHKPLDSHASPSDKHDPSEIDKQAYKDHLKKQFVLKRGSAKDIHEAASLSTAAGAEGVETFASIGGPNRNKKNMCSDLRRLMKKDAVMPQEYWAEIPVSNPQTGFENIYISLIII
jgi:hypothetical protein